MKTIRKVLNKSEEERYNMFCSELENLMTKYGVAIDSTGGIWIANTDQHKTMKKIIVNDVDHTSGDLYTKVIEN